MKLSRAIRRYVGPQGWLVLGVFFGILALGSIVDLIRGGGCP